MPLRKRDELLATGEVNSRAIATAMGQLELNRAANVGGGTTAGLLGVIAMTLIGLVPVFLDIADALDALEGRITGD